MNVTKMQYEVKDIIGYEGLYQVDTLGRVFSKITNKEMKVGYDSYGYKRVCLTKNKKEKTYKIHRLVATSFLNCKHTNIVDHINNKKDDNKIENLRICTTSQNAMNRKCNGIRLRTIRELKYWNASIVFEGKYYGKCFKIENDELFTKQQALKFRVVKEIELFKEFANKVKISKLFS